MKILYNTITQQTKPYPRSDDEAVVGLDAIYTVLTVVQEAEPTFDAATHHLLATEAIDLTAATLTQGWTIEANATLALGAAESYQVRAWMIRGGLDPATVPTIIAAVVTAGAARDEALMRWEYATRIPRDFPLVDVIGAQMGLTSAEIDAAWPDIQQI